MRCAVIVALVFWFVAPCSPPARAQAPQHSNGRRAVSFGQLKDIVNPDGDCRIVLENNGATITVPATLHDLSVERDQTNAPRILRDAKGDFTTRVLVDGRLEVAATDKKYGRLPFQGAGILLWRDADNYVRLERTAIYENRRSLSYALFELRKDGKLTESYGWECEDSPLYLQLERRGGLVLGYFSPDGVQWKAFTPLAVTLPNKVQVGVDAVNASDQLLTVRLVGFQLGGPDALEIPTDPWDGWLRGAVIGGVVGVLCSAAFVGLFVLILLATRSRRAHDAALNTGANPTV
jgi:hypothetical protein